jgi:lipopolysaccharide biosynthesis glycosyltransferase
MASADIVNTLFCVNSGFLQHAAVCLASLLFNNPDLYFNVVVVAQTSETIDANKLRRSLAGFANVSLAFQSFTIPDALILPLNPKARYTLDTYTRLWVGAFFPQDVNRVLYLDADMVVVGSIAPLWNADLAGALMGAVEIPGSTRGVTRLHLRPEDPYFNAGMLVIDLQLWRETKAEEEVIAYIQTYPERVLYDQDALNACFFNRTKRLAYKWNAIGPFYREPLALPLSRAEIEAVRREAIIIHYNGSWKPWSYFCDHPRRDEYNRYLQMTEWRDYVPPDRTPVNRIRKKISAILPSSLKRKLKTVFGQ